MQVRILTFHCAVNYGAVLQAYALGQKSLEFSDNVSVLNYCPSSITSCYSSAMYVLEFQKEKTVLEKVKALIRLFIIYPLHYMLLGYRKRKQKFNKFMKGYVLLDKDKITDATNITAGDANVIILGSDQIWNSNITGYDTAYFADFPRKANCKVISYAASIGNDVSSEKDKLFLRENIKNVDVVSVREETAKDVLSELTDKPIAVVLDPTLLLTAKEWVKIAEKPKQKDYILVYSMGNSEQVDKVVDNLSVHTGLEVVEILSGLRSLRKRYKHKIIASAGPCDFVGLFKNAKYVVTSSFHGTAFSIIFNKQFFVLPNGKVSSRMTDLLKKLNLSERFITDTNALPENDIDYNIVNALLEKEKEKSLVFLSRALSGIAQS